MNNRVYCWV
ncbi:hypothetical protein D046_3164A, partial [Vibrio parahaemolyticus V-223/04]